ncbi:PREDICTED: juvenile hormone acid O-methyltransferase-like [Trachymyrmex cornetzi]|uniref:juvenile hormone acid O-methyltransferase-like n=1 Tax=Trachymyrmex cornetzi TaxID=471704 RepID=UPI00084F6703|nr:PREDICTED: juvenile hormone acid O-methyltransferase-like [Trachymyrmex cornetzi]
MADFTEMTTGWILGWVRRVSRKQALHALVREYHRVINFDSRVFFDPQCIQNRPEYHSVPGTDISEKIVEYANRAFAIDEVFKFETLDIQIKDLPEKYIAEFDVVYSFPVLDFCNDIRQGFENIYNILRPGGTFCMVWVFSHEMFKIIEIMVENKRFASYLYKYNVPFLDTDTPHIVLKELLRSIGFTVYYCNTQNVNIDSLCDTLPFIIMSDFSFMYDMPSDRAKNFKKEFIGEYVKMTKGKYTHNDKSLTMDTYKVLIVNARKT